jgi:hypothetical protein
VKKYGSDIRRILRGFGAHDLPMPKFEKILDGFRLTVKGKRALGIGIGDGKQ